MGIKQFIVFAITIIITSCVRADEPIKKFVKESHDVVLPCNLTKGKIPLLSWSDNVFTQGESVDIVTLDRTSTKKNHDHEQRGSFSIDPITLALTIKNVTDLFPGTYTCTSKVGENTYQLSYSLATYKKFQCSDTPSVYKENDPFHHKCSIEYSGHEPELNILMDGKQLDNVSGENDVGMIEKHYNRTLRPEDNGKTVACVATMVDIIEQCSVTLSVTYPTRHLSLKQPNDSVSVGDTLECIADGNPQPTVVLQVDTPGVAMIIREGRGNVSAVVGDELREKEVNVRCSVKGLDKLRRREILYIHAPKAGGLHSSSEGKMSSLLLVLNGLMAAIIGFILH